VIFISALPQRLGLAICLLFASPCIAQNVFQADAQYQALTYTDSKGYKGCGIRAVVLYDTQLGELIGSDLSLNLWVRPSAFGIAKAAYLKAQPPSLKQIAPASFSLAAELDGIPLPMSAFQLGEDPGYIFSATSESETVNLLLSMLNGERIVVGVVEKGSAMERRFVFAAKLNPNDERTLLACLAAIAK
jgi:hypothetical protein